jgi:hypothetical protein
VQHCGSREAHRGDWFESRPLFRLGFVVDARRMIVRRALQAGIITKLGCHTFRATGITVYLLNGELLEYAADGSA